MKTHQEVFVDIHITICVSLIYNLFCFMTDSLCEEDIGGGTGSLTPCMTYWLVAGVFG